ncbi:class I SAM-dependent methyltransferase [Paucidesulfovibrio longus]|uniref:class I SAM-dependent methyltransferase n=1 Tax=Paucidesulfovibrio longus TaxID=889 RepID=UPI0003B31B1C|nr:class I SAM-dependent methyltransferase [Paucidesulfovibrio longus]
MSKTNVAYSETVWDDSYSGKYPPPQYEQQFELQWKLALEKEEFFQTPGSSTEEKYINDRVFEWTGVHPDGIDHFHDPSMGSRVMDVPVDPALIRGKKCLDLCCGHGRWTRVLQKLGAASVLSTDISQSALKATSRFNSNVRELDIMTLPDHPEMHGQFDFTNFWGVAMCTHDPRLAFENAASTVAPGGSMYLMVYAPDGIHGTRLTGIQRKIFHSLNSVEKRLAFVDKVWAKKWDWRYPLMDNYQNLRFNMSGATEGRGHKIGVLDMLSPAYNWVITLDTVNNWMRKAGFQQVLHLNSKEKTPCAYHVLGTLKC